MLIDNALAFGKAVRMARKNAGLSQAQLAERCGCSQRFVSEVERGKETAELGKALSLLHELDVPIEVGRRIRLHDGRAEVNYAVVRIAESLEAKPHRRRKLDSYIGAQDEA